MSADPAVALAVGLLGLNCYLFLTHLPVAREVKTPKDDFGHRSPPSIA